MKLRTLLFCVGAVIASVLRAQSSVDEASLHQQLRELKTTYETAINSGNLTPLEKYFDPKSSGVTIDNQTFHSFAELKGIYDGFHTRFPGVVYRVALTAEPSLLAGDLAVAQGTSEEYVKTSSGEFTYTGTWTAVLRRTNDGWKLVRSQMTMDPFGNSIVRFFQQRLRLTFGIGGLVLGALVGFVLGRLTRKQAA